MEGLEGGKGKKKHCHYVIILKTIFKRPICALQKC